jgi:phosphoglycolate phosphatase
MLEVMVRTAYRDQRPAVVLEFANDVSAAGRLSRPGPTMRLLLFDVDGTLIDSERVLIAAQQRTLARFGIPHPGQRAGLAVVGLSLPQAFRALLGPDADVSALSAAYREDFAALRADPAYDAPLYPGASDIIDVLAARDDVVMGLATGKSRRGVAHLLKRHGWHGHFTTIQTADTNPSKPDPAWCAPPVPRPASRRSAQS